MSKLKPKKPGKDLFRPSWRIANDLLIWAIVLVNLYTILRPFYPLIYYKLHKPVVVAPAGSHLSQQGPNKTPVPKPSPQIEGNRLIIPSIGLDQQIFEGKSVYTLNKGIWIRPNASTPDKGSNTVLAGHRFTYSGPAVFYHLDQLHTDDKFLVYWNGVEYDYQVTETKVVPPTAIEIENPTKDSQMTIFTCTPLWNPKDRLVIIGKLIYSGN